MDKLKMGVLGVSNHFIKRILFPLKRAKNVEIYAIASRTYSKAESLAKEHGIKKWYGSYEELLKDEEVEAVYIPLPNHLHAEYIRKAADAKKHILCEKPLTPTYEETTQAIKYAKERGVFLMEAFMYKFHPQWIRAKEIVKSRELGQIQTINCYFSYDNKDPKNFRNVPEFGGGVLLDIGVYAVSTARFLLDKEPQRVLSLLQKSENFHVDNLVSGILDFGEARALFTVAGEAFPSQRVDVYGTAGTLSVEVPFNTYPDTPAHLSVRTTIGQREVYLGPADHYLLEFEYFAEAVRKKIPLSELNEDSILNMKVIEKLFLSSKNNGWEKL